MKSVATRWSLVFVLVTTLAAFASMPGSSPPNLQHQVRSLQAQRLDANNRRAAEAHFDLPTVANSPSPALPGPILARREAARNQLDLAALSATDRGSGERNRCREASGPDRPARKLS